MTQEEATIKSNFYYDTIQKCQKSLDGYIPNSKSDLESVVLYRKNLIEILQRNEDDLEELKENYPEFFI